MLNQDTGREHGEQREKQEEEEVRHGVFGNLVVGTSANDQVERLGRQGFGARIGNTET